MAWEFAGTAWRSVGGPGAFAYVLHMRQISGGEAGEEWGAGGLTVRRSEIEMERVA
jgi:hypothetical protein